MKDIKNEKDKALYGSFVPNFVRHRFSKENSSEFVSQASEGKAALLWLDVHHFSALCNRLMKESESGVQKISSILHQHYDFLLEEIVRYGGTPLFFVGDGLVAIWPTGQMSIEDSIRSSISCAFEILSKRRARDDKNELISIHAVVAYGSWEMMELDGPYSKKHLSYYGEVFNELRSASKNRAPNHVLIRDSLIDYIEGEINTKPLEYETSILVDNPFETALLNAEDGLLQNYPDEALNKLEQFVPTTLKSPLSRERLEWLSEVRPVSVIFVRFDNSIENTQEKLRDTNELAKIATPLVEKHDGLLNMIWTDEKATNILICFGPAPSAHVDNPLRSVKLALEMNEVLKKKGYASSIGIGSGIAYCGVLGNDYLRQHTIIGDVVNLTARYAAIHTHGIVCDETTFKATRKSVSFDSPINRTIKGESDTVELFPVNRLELDDSSQHKLVSDRIIRREKELNTILNSFETTDADNSSLVVLDGESGMGKSTLRKTFLSEINKEERVFVNSAYFIERKTPYYIWNEIVMSILGLESSRVDEQETVLKNIEERFRERSCLLNIVLHTNFPENDWFHGLTAAQKVEESERLLLEIFERESIESKLIILIDNSQWIDQTSWGLIESMNASLGNIFILLTFSGEASETGIDFSKFKNLEHVRLKGMNEEDLGQLLSTKIGIDSIPDELISLTKKVAKGNPFFSLEFVNYLIDEELLRIDETSCILSEGVHKGEHVLPDNIRGALRQRIDKLDAGSQLTLKVGSVVGYKFGKDIVGDIYPIMNERHYVHTYLDEAQSSGFLVDTVVDNYDGYFFNNSAVADVSYESILTDQKRFLHEKSALWYEKNFEKNLQPFYVRLAYHWNEAGDKIKSLSYFKLESTRLFSLGFVRQALLVGMEGVKILDYTLSLDKEIIGSQIGAYSQEIQGLMEGKSIPDLFKHKTLENSQTDELLEMLLYLSPLAHQCHEAEFFALLSIICLKITLEEGNGIMASKVYAMYSIIYKAFTGDSVNALEWSNLALALDEKNDDMHKASVSFIHGWFIAHWMNPVRSLMPLADEGAEAGFQSGDILYACFNLSLSVILKNAAGVQLETVIESANENLLKNNNIVVNAAFHLKHEKQMALAFQGKTNSYVSLSDEHIDEDKEIAVICESDMYNQIGYYFISKLKLNAHYGNWQEALSWGDKAFPLLMAFANQPGQVDLEFYYGLSCLYRSAEEEGEASDKLTQRAEQSLETFENWSGNCAENFMHKHQILKAVKDSLNGDHQSAEVLFQEAAAHAHAGKFYQDEGLAYEHWIRMNHRLKKDFSKEINNAKEAYSLWGAKAKVDYLENEFNT